MKIAVLLFFALVLTETSFGQSSTVSSGGNATGSGGTASYSIGQPAYTTNTGSTGSAAWGVQQPYEISILIGVNETQVIDLTGTVYPNPAMESIKLAVKGADLSGLKCALFDMNGKLLSTQPVELPETTISLQGLAASNYFLNITDSHNKEVKKIKIIKN